MSRRSFPLKQRPRPAFHLWPEQKHHEHEGRNLGRSRVWQRFSNTTEYFDEMTEDNTKETIQGFLKQERSALELLESNWALTWTRWKPVVSIGVKGIVGATMCLAGAHFGRCVVLFHTMRVTGWPAFQNAVMELGKSYCAAREVVKAEVGKVVRPRELLQAVSYELKGVRCLIRESQKALEDGVMTKAEAKEILRQAQVDKKKLEYESWCLNQALDSLSALSAAIDTNRLKDAGKGLYTGMVACVASAHSVTVRKLSLAFDLGSILSGNINCVMCSLMERIHSQEMARFLPPETRKFLKMSIQIAGMIQGLLIINTVVPKMSLRISSAALGAAWLSDAIAETCDPWLKAHEGWEPIAGRLPYAILQVSLTVGGYYVQKKVYPGRFPLLVERFLAPLGFVESRLKDFNGLFKK